MGLLVAVSLIAESCDHRREPRTLAPGHSGTQSIGAGWTAAGHTTVAVHSPDVAQSQPGAHITGWRGRAALSSIRHRPSSTTSAVEPVAFHETTTQRSAQSSAGFADSTSSAAWTAVVASLKLVKPSPSIAVSPRPKM